MVKPLIFGIESTKLSEKEIELFKLNEVAGFILFSRNISSKNQLVELTKSLKDLYPNRKVPIFIDQEGGKVARIKPPIADQLYPSAEHFAEIYKTDKLQAKLELKANYIKLMSELKALGIDSPCAPTCDILYSDASDVIGSRSFGDNADKVIDLCKSAIRGILHSEGIPFIKHIPGHGRATVDSHFDLPIINTTLEELEESDFKVFKELAKENAWGMTAHIIYNALDTERTATTSPIVIDYIRKKIGFQNILVSDDICMYALHGVTGKKKSTLEQIIKLAENKSPWRESLSLQLKELFYIDASQLDNISAIELCKKNLREIKPEFLESLAKVARMSIEAGCDMILHCSGDIDEMHSICKEF